MVPMPDGSYPDVELSHIAFGSCHSRGAVNKRLSKFNGGTDDPNSTSTIWDVINTSVQPQAFLWTGDAIYPPMKVKGDTPLEVMHEEYRKMLHNSTFGYDKFINNQHLVGGVHGVWDDHDYGGNDRGRELKQREERRDAYLDFLGVPKSDSRRHRQGLYSSIEFGSDGMIADEKQDNLSPDRVHNNKVKVIFLDTRWHREKHCIPSVGSNRYIPYGAIVACITRWFTAGFDLPSNLPSICASQKDNAVLGDEQWLWLENELNGSTASVYIVVSSIQVLTTNPVVESWGHFPNEQAKLLRLLNNVPGLVILSGDVHHAEISTTSNLHPMQRNGAIIEVTSSGLTHSCSGPRLYGPLCQPILNLFPAHRFEGGNVNDASAPSYYTGLNFGSIDFDWSKRSFEVKVHNENGEVILSTGELEMSTAAGMSTQELESVAKCIDGHLVYFMKKMNVTGWALLVLALYCLRYYFLKPLATRQHKYSKVD
jgi:alkaline phosphatase D